MKQLSGMDATFLNMETRSTFGHVSSLNVFDVSDLGRDEFFEGTRRLVEKRLGLLAPFRRRLVEVFLVPVDVLGLATRAGRLAATFTKVHHAAIDGAAGATMLASLLDIDRDASWGSKPVPWHPEAVPTDRQLIERTML